MKVDDDDRFGVRFRTNHMPELAAAMRGTSTSVPESRRLALLRLDSA